MNVQILDGDFLCCEFYFTYAATLLALYNSGNYIFNLVFLFHVVHPNSDLYLWPKSNGGKSFQCLKLY